MFKRLIGRNFVTSSLCMYVWMYVCMFVCMCVSVYVCMYACVYICMYFFIIFIGMLHYIILSNTTRYLHWIYSGYFYIDSLQWLFFLHGLLLVFTILIVVFVCMLVLSLQCVEFFYFVHSFREFCECFVVFFDKHIFFYRPVVCLHYCCYWAFSFFSQYSAFKQCVFCCLIAVSTWAV